MEISVGKGDQSEPLSNADSQIRMPEISAAYSVAYLIEKSRPLIAASKSPSENSEFMEANVASNGYSSWLQSAFAASRSE